MPPLRSSRKVRRARSHPTFTTNEFVGRADTKRIKKSLKATHATGISVVLHQAQNAPDEADFVARQIKHIVAHTGGLVDYGDMAILLRYGALSRNIEVALQKAGIPSRMVGGHKVGVHERVF